jgi:hypothetical protein
MEVISNVHTKPAYQNNVMTRTQFWAISEEWNKEVVTVVIRQVGDGKKHFFSVYNKKSSIR